jgi:dTDP-4-dehydrorhamnose 3,5-epimerase-like enzyme
VRCTKGAVFDVIVDLRPESPTYLEQLVVVLSTENARGLYVPKRFAHGFITLEDDTELTTSSANPIRQMQRAAFDMTIRCWGWIVRCLCVLFRRATRQGV